MRKLPIAVLIALLLLTASVCTRSENIQSHTAFTNVNLVPMTSEIVVEDQTVLIKGEKIIAIDDSDKINIPDGTQIINGQGFFLMPGLADMHMHTRADWEDDSIWPVNPLNLYLANGVTTVRDFAPTGSLSYALQRRAEIRNGIRPGPTIYTSGKLLYASPLENPQEIVRENFARGFDFLKVYSYLSKDDFQRAMDTANELGMYTSGHIPFAVGLNLALAEGLDEIAHVEELFYEFLEFDRENHLLPEEWLPYIVETALLKWEIGSSELLADFQSENASEINRMAARLRSSDVPVSTTMVVDDIIYKKLFQSDALLNWPENQYFESGYLENYKEGNDKHQLQCRGIEALCAFKYDIDRLLLRALHDAGVTLLLGTDSGTGGMGIIPGFSIHDELRILVENGFTPYEAIATGTVNAAKIVERMTGEGDFGSIEVGKKADLILVRDNPLEDVGNIRNPMGVMAAGNWFSEDEIQLMITITQ